jgi:hypothetical protein
MFHTYIVYSGMRPVARQRLCQQIRKQQWYSNRGAVFSEWSELRYFEQDKSKVELNSVQYSSVRGVGAVQCSGVEWSELVGE